MAKGLLVLILIAGAAFFIYRQTRHEPSEEEALVAPRAGVFLEEMQG